MSEQRAHGALRVEIPGQNEPLDSRVRAWLVRAGQHVNGARAWLEGLAIVVLQTWKTCLRPEWTHPQEGRSMRVLCARNKICTVSVFDDVATFASAHTCETVTSSAGLSQIGGSSLGCLPLVSLCGGAMM